MKNIINELSWRGLIQDKVFGIENISYKPIIYIGFDPTSDSLHIGSIIPIIIIIHLKKNGYNVLVLIGGATGLIGDPSDRYEKKKFLHKDILKKNIKYIKKQIFNLLNFFSVKIELFNNYDWIKNLSFLDFLNEVGNNFSVNYLISKKFIKKRFTNKKNGLSITELIYSLIQGYDFFYLNNIKNCLIQIGGSDQWGNITIGIDLIRKKTGKKAYGFTFPLITKSDGKKFGKSEESGNIWLDKNKTSPYQFYQFWINTADNEVEKLIKMYTFFTKEKIKELIYKHNKNPNKRILQKVLADEITKWVHGVNIHKEITKVIYILFNKKNINNLDCLNEIDCSFIYKHLPNKVMSKKYLKNGIFVSDLLKNSGFFSSKKKAIHCIKINTIYINKVKVKYNFLVGTKNIICKEYILLQYGKKNFFMIKIKK